MKANSKAFKASIVVALAACVLALTSAPARAVRQAETRGVSIRVGEGKDLKLYERSYALVIGVGAYTGGWPNLPGVKKDIEAVSVALEKQGFQVTKVENPDSAQLEKAFKEFIDAYGVGVENRLLFYFAGHGHTVKQSYGEEMGYIVPSDAPLPSRDLAGFMSKAMDMQQMELYARRIQSKHALFLFDSCFSGAIFALARAVPDAISYKTARPVRQFITSGSADETVPDQSIFRHQFVEALEGEADLNHDNYVTGTELGEFLQDKVINYSKNTQHPQYGKLRNPNLDKGDFVFALPKAPKSTTTAAAADPTPAQPARVDQAALDLTFWTSIQNSTDAEDYKAYLKKFPNGTYATLARRRVQQYASTRNAALSPKLMTTWIKNALGPGINFGDVDNVEINAKFPAAAAVRANIMQVGAPATIMESFGEREPPPEHWVISIGSEVNVRAAQAVIAACLKNTDEVWSVHLLTKDEDLISYTRQVYVGTFDYTETRRLSREELLRLLNPSLNAARLHALLPKE